VVDPGKRLRDYVMKNALQIVISLLLTVLIAVFAYHFRRVEALEARVWNLEQGKSSVEVLTERTTNLQKQIDELCARVEKSTTRLEAMITELLKINGLSASVYMEPEQGG
jgi:cell division protein FtsB